MFLAKTHARSVRIPLGFDLHKYPPKLEPEVLNSLVEKLRTEDATEEVEKAIVIGHIRLAVDIAGRYSNFFRNESDDILSAALFGLVTAVRRAKKRLRDNNITPYIVTTVHSHCSDHIRKIHRQSKRTRQVRDDIDIKIVEQERLGETIETLEVIAMTKDEKSVVKYCLEGLSDTEIGLKIGLERSSINRIRNRLRERWEEVMKKENSNES